VDLPNVDIYNAFLQKAENDNVSGEEILSFCILSAVHGNADNQFRLANVFQEGFVIEQDNIIEPNKEMAAWLCTQAAEQGDVNAQAGLAITYGHGIGVEKDKEKAAHWCKKAAEQGHEGAQKLLNLMELGISDFD